MDIILSQWETWLPVALSVLALAAAGAAYSAAARPRPRSHGGSWSGDGDAWNRVVRSSSDGTKADKMAVDQLARQVAALETELRALQHRGTVVDGDARPSAGAATLSIPPEAPVEFGGEMTDVSPSTESPPPPPAGQPVELDGGVVVLSRSLAALATVVEDGRGGALLYLNETVEIDHMALERWADFFDFSGGRAYARYRTDSPAVLSWDRAQSRGTLARRGAAHSL